MILCFVFILFPPYLTPNLSLHSLAHTLCPPPSPSLSNLEGDLRCHGEAVGNDRLFFCGASLPAVQLDATAARKQDLLVHLHRGAPRKLASCDRKHTHTHTHTHGRTPAQTYKHMYKYTHTHGRTPTQTQTHTHTHTNVHTYTHRRTHTHTNKYKHMYTHTNTHTHTHMDANQQAHKQRQTDAQTCTYKYMQSGWHTHTHTRTHTHTHTHTQCFLCTKYFLLYCGLFGLGMYIIYLSYTTNAHPHI